LATGYSQLVKCRVVRAGVPPPGAAGSPSDRPAGTRREPPQSDEPSQGQRATDCNRLRR